MAHARRTYLIDRGFQLKYTTILVCVGAAISLLFGFMMYQAHREATELLELPDPYKMVVSQHDNTLLYVVIGISVVMALALGLFGVLVTHRVAGPIYVLTHYMQVLGEGRFPLLRPLRKNDELKTFFETFQSSVDAMREREKSDAVALQAAVSAMESAATASPDVAAKLKEHIEKVRGISSRRLEAAQNAEPATPGQKAEAAKSAA